MMLTLWDLIEPVLRRGKRPAKPPAAPVAPSAPPLPAPPAAAAKIRRPSPHTKVRQPKKALAPARDPSAPSMQGRYDAVVQQMLAKYEVRVRKWRGGMTGIAWYVTYKDGRVVRLIEAPKPKGPMSAAVFLHEIGHHAIGFNTYKPRCLEEYHAWAWSLAAMEEHGLNITDAVRHRMHLSLWYAVQKAQRRGIKSVPPELTPFLDRPPPRRRG